MIKTGSLSLSLSRWRHALATYLIFSLVLSPAGFASSQCLDPPPQHIDNDFIQFLVVVACCCYNNVPDGGFDLQYFAEDTFVWCDCPDPIGGTCTRWWEERHLRHHTDTKPGNCHYIDGSTGVPINGTPIPHYERREICRCRDLAGHDVGSCNGGTWNVTNTLSTYICKVCPGPNELHPQCLRNP